MVEGTSCAMFRPLRALLLRDEKWLRVQLTVRLSGMFKHRHREAPAPRKAVSSAVVTRLNDGSVPGFYSTCTGDGDDQRRDDG